MTTAVAQAARMARRIEAAEFQGFGDTREAARARAARRWGLSEPYLTRLIYRSRMMRDVSGQALLLLQRACAALDRSTMRADAHRKAIENELLALRAPLAGGANAPSQSADTGFHPAPHGAQGEGE